MKQYQIWRTITKEQMIEAVKHSYTIKETLIKLGLSKKTYNYAIFNKKIKEYNISINHFLGLGWSKGKKVPRPLQPLDVFISNKNLKSSRLRERLILLGISKRQCNRCKQTKWLGQDIPLELHHIDSNRQNNNLDNVEILCPNCHTLTANHAIAKKYRK